MLFCRKIYFWNLLEEQIAGFSIFTNIESALSEPVGITRQTVSL
jgi:hypothetical protein